MPSKPVQNYFPGEMIHAASCRVHLGKASGLILCGTYLFPLIGQEKGFKPSTSPQVAISSLELLKQRLAKGEIDREEYLELKKLIGE